MEHDGTSQIGGGASVEGGAGAGSSAAAFGGPWGVADPGATSDSNLLHPPNAAGVRPLQTVADMPLSAFAMQSQVSAQVGPSSPLVPGKIAEKIWRGEYVDLSMLLPHRLGAPEPTLAEALQKRTRDDKLITTIEQWVVCLSAYMSVLVLGVPLKQEKVEGRQLVWSFWESLWILSRWK